MVTGTPDASLLRSDDSRLRGWLAASRWIDFNELKPGKCDELEQEISYSAEDTISAKARI